MKLLFGAFFLSLLAGSVGCESHVTVPVSGQTTPVPRHLRLVVMDSPNWDFRWDERGTFHESGLADCLAKELAAKPSLYTLIPAEMYTRAAYPSLPDELVPRTPEYVRIALTNDGVQERIRSLELDYLIYILGTTELEHDWGDVLCGVGYGGGGCLGIVNIDKRSNISAVVVDVDATQEMISVGAQSSGELVIAVLGILPVWYEAPTKRAACRTLAEKLDATFER